MNNLKSYTEYAVNTPTTDFVIGFDFNYGTDAVNVTVDDVPATEAGYSVIYLNSTTIRLNPAVPSGVVRLQRETDIDVPDNRFTAGAKFIASNMDENFTQIRHAQQEVRDGFGKLSEDTYEIIDTLQVVGQAAQDAADAAEQAAQTANDAAAQVNDKVSYQDLDDAVEVAVKNNTVYFYPTVTQMVADTNVADGAIVATRGYYNISDDGGAIYLISAVATGYSIPLANGLHAVFRDTFDIRKFGIVSSPTLDQTTNLLRMRNYADERIYEVDLLGFDLLSPKSINYTSARGSILRGLYFHRPHKIKNAKFYHDKNEQLVQGSCPIQFTPKTLGSGETFELENIDFDIYIQNHLLISQEGDGRLHGFYAGWHPDYPVGWPANVQTPSGYKFKATNINSVTAGVTSTLALGIQFNKTEFYNLRGDYIGYYSTFNGTDVTAKNCHAVYRADLHAAGRLLVTNQFQFEPEVEDLVYTLDKHVFEDLVCVTNTGVSHNCVKYEKKGSPTYNEIKLKNVFGQFAFSASSSSGVRVLNLDIDNVQRVFNLPYRADKIRIKNSPISDVLFANAQNIDSDIVLTSCEINSAVFYTGASINNVKFVDCTYNAGICRAPVDIRNVVLLGGQSHVHRVLEADFESLTVEGNFTYAPTNAVLTAVFLKVGTKYTSSRVTLNHNSFETLPELLIAVSTALVDTQSIEARVYFNDFKTTPTFRLGNSGSLDAKFNSKQLTGVGSKTYDPPSLTNATQQSTTVTLTGATLGDNISVAFDKALSGTRMWGEVTSTNTVTVYHRNDTGATVDVPSGTLSVKVI